MIFALDFTTLAPLIQSMTFWNWFSTIITFIVITATPLLVKYIFERIKKNRDDKDEQEENINHHANCPFFGDEHYYDIIQPFIDEAVQKSRAIDRKEYELKEMIKSLEHERFLEQMASSDRSMTNIKEKLTKLFNNHKKTTPANMRLYSRTLDDTLENTQEIKLKKYIKANHFADRSDDEFELYKINTTKTLQSFHIMELDREYYSEDYEISRNEVRELNEPIMHDIKDELFRLLDELRKIAIKYKLKIEELENEMVSG